MKELCGAMIINKNSFTFDGKTYNFRNDKTDKRLANEGLWNVECKVINVPITVIVFKNEKIQKYKQSKNLSSLGWNGTYKFFDKNNQEIESIPILRALLKIRKTEKITREIARKYFKKI